MLQCLQLGLGGFLAYKSQIRHSQSFDSVKTYVAQEESLSN